MALHHQNAELDYDIASVLRKHACQPLDEEIEHLASLLASCASRSQLKEAVYDTLDEVRTLRGTALRLLAGVCEAGGHLTTGQRSRRPCVLERKQFADVKSTQQSDRAYAAGTARSQGLSKK